MLKDTPLYPKDFIMSNTTHLMFDIETLGVREHTVVTTLACVPFTFEDEVSYTDLVNKGFFAKFNIKEQIKTYKRTTDAPTIDWWKRQSDEAKFNSITPSDNDVTLLEGCTALRKWIKTTDYDFHNSFVWSRGSYFDFPKIEDLYRDLKENAPFNGFKIRDTRTLIDVLTGSLKGDYTLENGAPKGFIHHHSLHDAALEVAKIKEIYKSMTE